MLIKIFTLICLFFSVLANAMNTLPDPTRPANYIVESNEPVYVEVFSESPNEQISWTLSAVRISDKDKTAIVNGQLVRVGDEINDAKIVEIKSQSVVINHENKKLIVRLFNDLIIKDYKSKK